MIIPEILRRFLPENQCGSIPIDIFIDIARRETDAQIVAKITFRVGPPEILRIDRGGQRPDIVPNHIWNEMRQQTLFPVMSIYTIHKHALIEVRYTLMA